MKKKSLITGRDMGLDQYAYVANRAGQRAEFFDGAEYDSETSDIVNPNVSRPQELAYWRKHPNLQGWMENLYRDRGGEGSFNGEELELTWDDVNDLERDIKSGLMANLNTTGFFFGNASDEMYKKQDLQFCIDAKAEIFLGRKVFYNSSW